MSEPLLKTKLHIPRPRAELVPRPQLVARLSAGLGQSGSGFARKLTLVAAPAGSGKTTVVTAWVSNLRGRTSDTQGCNGDRPLSHRVAWLSLDEADNDPARFFTYLVMALQTVDPQIGEEALRLLKGTRSVPAEAVVTTLINDLVHRTPSVVLVLDDYHVITELAIHEAIAFLLEQQPPHMHVVIATRHDPPLPLSRLRGRGQISEIRQRDLCFSKEEAAAFLNRCMALQLTTPEIAALEERTEGWIAGLQLAGRLTMLGGGPGCLVGRLSLLVWECLVPSCLSAGKGNAYPELSRGSSHSSH